MKTVDTMRGVTSFFTGSVPKARMASICSVTTMEPSSLAIPDAFRPATIRPVEPATRVYYIRSQKMADDWALREEGEWVNFVLRQAPKLESQGWRIEMDPDFAFRMAQPEEWYADAQAQSGADWFNAEIGVQLEGQKINLLPILMEYFAERKDLFGASALSQLDEQGLVLVPLPDGRRLPFPVARLKVMLNVLLDLFEPKSLDELGRMRLTRVRAAELSGTADAGAWRWLGGEALRELNGKLRDFRSIRPLPPPQGLQTSLRGYQQEGLNWLQFLRDYGLAGILADDMGLGKTVQALAHLLEEKNSGRADRPSLVVAPTSLMTNWRQETERFAPALKLLVLARPGPQGTLRETARLRPDRHLLCRCCRATRRFLLKEQFHLVILDEAQYIKNPKTKYAQIVCQLRARHPLCLTGTPMENHLGELWSQFNFLLPGFLGDEARFRKLFRNPIEKGATRSARAILARRIAPVCPAAAQGGGGAGTAAQNRDQPERRTGRAQRGPLRNHPPGHAPAGSGGSAQEGAVARAYYYT